jgi:hypothetical protein
MDMREAFNRWKEHSTFFPSVVLFIVVLALVLIYVFVG